MTLHTLSMLMKIHSYCSYNGELSAKAIQLRKNQAALEILITASGGREKAEAEARSVWGARSLCGSERCERRDGRASRASSSSQGV